MKKLLILSILFWGKSYSQDLEDLKIPYGYTKISETKGDLDKDGVDETAIVYETSKVDKDSFFTRELYICKTKEKQLKIWKRNSTVLFSKRDSFSTDDEKIGLKISNNTLIIEQTWNGSSRGHVYYKNIYRFQNNDWYLIGSTYIDDYACLWKNTTDINFSTNQVIVTRKNQCCADVYECDDKARDEKYSFKYPFEKIVMDQFTPGEKDLKIPNSKKEFTY